MSVALANEGRKLDALPFAVYAVGLSRSAHGTESSGAIDAMLVHSQLRSRLSRVEEANATLGRVLAASTRVFGPDHELTRQTQDALREVVSLTGFRVEFGARGSACP